MIGAKKPEQNPLEVEMEREEDEDEPIPQPPMKGRRHYTNVL
jgi:hypothetical protein